MALGWAVWAMKNVPLDAIPDLSENQVIVFTEWMGRSPQTIEDQITYPIVTKLVAAPKVRVVRGYSFFGYSFVYVVFEDGTDIYWARSRVLEYMQSVKLPAGAQMELGPARPFAEYAGRTLRFKVTDVRGRDIVLSRIDLLREGILREVAPGA